MSLQNIQVINSADNQQIKLLAKLNSLKYRRQAKQFMVENLTIILDALASGFDFESIYITEEFVKKNGDKIKYLQNNSQSLNYYLISGKLNKIFSNLETPSGITAIYKIKPNILTKTSVVYLNGISDPGNLGTIMRSALALGFNNLILDNNCVDIYNFKVINAAKDAIFKLNIFEDTEGNWLKKNKLPLYATSSHQGSSLSNFKAAKNFCLVLGSESHGVSPEILKLASKTIKIEIFDKIESLNVATASAILFYELRQK